MKQEKEEVFNTLKKKIDPKHLENLNDRVRDLDSQLVLMFGLLLSYGGKNDDIDFLNMVWR